MVISVDIPDEIVEQAQSLDLTPEGYIASLIANQRKRPDAPISREERMAKLERFFEQISANSEKILLFPTRLSLEKAFIVTMTDGPSISRRH